MKKRSAALLLALAMIVALLPAVSLADAPAAVYVGAAALTDGDYTTDGATVAATVPTDNYAYYHGGTLTLKNFTYSGDGKLEFPYLYAAIYVVGDITLELIGTSSVTCTKSGDYYHNGFYINGSVTVTGSGTLTAAGGDSAGRTSVGIFSTGTLTLQSGTLICTGGATTGTNNSNGIECAYVNVEDGTLRGTGNTFGGAIKNACVTGGALELTGGTGGVNITDTIPGSFVISGGVVKLSGGTRASSFTPLLTDYPTYMWRTASDAAYASSTFDAYEYSSSDTYIEIKPADYTMDFTLSAATWGGLNSVDLTTTDASGAGWA